MNDKINDNANHDRDDETLARLLQLAGPRSPVPPDVERRVYDSVHGEWQAATQRPDERRVYTSVYREWRRDNTRRRAVRWALPVALAASVLVAIGLVQPPPKQDVAPVMVGSIVKLVGFDGGEYANGQSIPAGSNIVTGEGEGMSLQLANAASLRIDENTMLEIDSGNRMTLVRGRVYADTGDFVYRNNRLVIDTAHGAVTDIGTQFVVAADSEALDVAVREGRVDIRDGTVAASAVAGERLMVRDGRTDLEAIAPHDEFWDWTAALAPAFDIENRSLLEFLRWAARETGRELEFADEELRLAAMRTDLHGSVGDLTPTDAIVSVLATTRFRYRIESDRLVIER